MTEIPDLLHSTGNARTDAMVRGAVGIFEAAFPRRVRGYYLFGSYADGSAVGSSDLDLFVVFRDDFVDEQEADRARQLRHACSQLSAIPCDLLSFSERHLFAEGHFRLKEASVLVYGEDMRGRMPALSLDAYVRDYTQAPVAYMGRVLRHRDTLVYPLHFPDSSGPFFGYDSYDARMGADGGRSIKGWANAVCWVATMMVALQSGRMICTKAESVRAYRAYIGDQWAAFVEAVYANGKAAWGYRVPDDLAARALLRDLCRETLAFENHYLTRYRTYLLEHLRRSDEASIRFAVERLGRVVYPDTEVIETLRAVAMHGPAALRDVAQATLGRIAGASPS